MAEHKPKRDIMDRLLDWDEVATRSICADDGGCFRCDAADEIRWLRGEVQRLKQMVAEHQGYIMKQQDADGLR